MNTHPSTPTFPPIEVHETQHSPRINSPLALPLIGAGLLIGLAGDALLKVFPWGINVFLFVLVLMGVVVWIARQYAITLTGGGRWLAVPALVFAAAYALRDSDTLRFLCLLAVLTALALLGVRARVGRVRVAALMEYVAVFVFAGVQAGLGAFLLLVQDADFTHIKRSGHSFRRFSGVLIGLLIALPLLLVFGALFASADPAFDGLVRKLFDWDLSTVFQHVFWWAMWSWLAAGFLRLLFISGAAPMSQVFANRRSFITLGITEIAIVLGLLSLMFAVFVALQFNYLFSLVPLSLNNSLDPYSDFARRGFFELVTVAALLLPVLLAAHAVLRKDQLQHERIFRGLAGLLVLLMFVIMTSALQRMWLYAQNFGLTELRIYTTAFMVWLGLVFAWFACTVLAGKPNRFVFGALCAGFVMIAALIALNPDDLIVRTNVARIGQVSQTGTSDNASRSNRRGYDADYAVRLSFSADAVPALIEALPRLEEKDRCRIAAGILNQWTSPETVDLRSAHWAQFAARQAVRANFGVLQSMACVDQNR